MSLLPLSTLIEYLTKLCETNIQHYDGLAHFATDSHAQQRCIGKKDAFSDMLDWILECDDVLVPDMLEASEEEADDGPA